MTQESPWCGSSPKASQVRDPWRAGISVWVQRREIKRIHTQLGGSQAAGVPSFLFRPFCFMQAFDWWDKAHPHRGGPSALLILQIQMLISSRHSLRDTSRMFDQMSRHHVSQSAWHKTNHHKGDAGLKGQKGCCILRRAQSGRSVPERCGPLSWKDFGMEKATQTPSWSWKALGTEWQEKEAYVGCFCKSEVLLLSRKFYQPRYEYILVTQDNFIRKIRQVNYLTVHTQ